jgi:ribonuclease BN (tRNA processing enzyme)
LIIHTRDADTQTATVLAEAAKGGVSGVLHCFSSTRQLAEKALELGFYISISGIVTFKNAEGLREIVRDLPLDRLLVENRRAIPCASASSGPAKRAGALDTHRTQTGGCEGPGAECSGSRHHRQFLPPVCQGGASKEPAVMRVTVLGCGGSAGVPMIGRPGGYWGDCDPANPRNRRRRVSILIEEQGQTILIDSSPDLREQLLAADVTRLDAVLYTHDHADHINGIDELRHIRIKGRNGIDCYGTADTMSGIAARFRYAFEQNEVGSGVLYRPFLKRHDVSGLSPWGQCPSYHLRKTTASAARPPAIASQTWRIRRMSSSCRRNPGRSWLGSGCGSWIACAKNRIRRMRISIRTLSWIERIKPSAPFLRI